VAKFNSPPSKFALDPNVVVTVQVTPEHVPGPFW
jgi:hypothetical protein